MGSRLIGLKRKLAWSEFRGSMPAGTNFAAETNSSFKVSTPKFQKEDGAFWLVDDVQVTVTFDGNLSWKSPELLNSSDQLQQELLDHEQGHYDITALTARDLFIALMQLKGSSWSSPTDGSTDFNWWVREYGSRLNKCQAAYDGETGHSQANVFVPSTSLFTPPHQKGGPQIKWERLIASAFTKPRNPPQSAPDGTPYKEELVTILKAAGVNL